MRQRRQRPGEVEREVELVGRVLDVGPLDHRVLEAEQHPRVDLERQVEVDGALAALLGVEVDLPVLAQRVALDEVPLVVHVEPVLDRVVLEVGHEPGDVDDCHRLQSLQRARRPGGRRPGYGTRGPGARARASRRPSSRRSVRPSPSSGTNTGSYPKPPAPRGVVGDRALDVADRRDLAAVGPARERDGGEARGAVRRAPTLAQRVEQLRARCRRRWRRRPRSGPSARRARRRARRPRARCRRRWRAARSPRTGRPP